MVYAPFNDLYKKMKKYILTFHNYDETEILSYTRRNSLEQWMSHAAINAGAAARIFEVIEKNFQIRCDHTKSNLGNFFSVQQVSSFLVPLLNFIRVCQDY